MITTSKPILVVIFFKSVVKVLSISNCERVAIWNQSTNFREMFGDDDKKIKEFIIKNYSDDFNIHFISEFHKSSF